MTDTEIRQIQNERDFFKRKADALERKYAPLHGRSCLAIVATRRGRKWQGETIFIEDRADAVSVSNYLRRLEAEIVRQHRAQEETAPAT